MKMTGNMRGALLMAGSMTAFAVNDTFVKIVGETLPFFQILFLRGVGVTLLLGVMAHRAGVLRFDFSRQDQVMIAIRALGELGGAYFFLNALFHMPIGNVTAILQALPLTVTLAAALVFRDRVGWRRWAAIGVGMIGVLMIVRPGSDVFNAYSLYALTAVACITVRDLAARKLSDDVPSLTVAFITAGGILAFAAVGAAFIEWKPVSFTNWALLIAAVVAIMFAYLFSVSAMRNGDVSFVAPFRYVGLLAALILGVLVFGDRPDSWTLIGSGIVVATGLFTLWRERQRPPKPPVGLRIR